MRRLPVYVLALLIAVIVSYSAVTWAGLPGGAALHPRPHFQFVHNDEQVKAKLVELYYEQANCPSCYVYITQGHELREGYPPGDEGFYIFYGLPNPTPVPDSNSK